MHPSTPLASATTRFLLRLTTSNKHAAAAVTRASDGVVVASASTAEKAGGAEAAAGVASSSPSVGVSSATVEHHRLVGDRLAARLAAAGVTELTWVRRSGQRHHGRARALMEGLAAGGVRLG